LTEPLEVEDPGTGFGLLDGEAPRVIWICGQSRTCEVLEHHVMPYPAGEDGLSGRLPAS
jgi:hypothetical protein